jgi:hypothetical protein
MAVCKIDMNKSLTLGAVCNDLRQNHNLIVCRFSAK